MASVIPTTGNNNNNNNNNNSPPIMSDREKELLEQSQQISNELMLERQIRVANALLAKH
jgi:hypothetical protein